MTEPISLAQLTDLVTDFVAQRPEAAGTRNWWRTPLLVTAPIDDRFDILPQVAAPDHLAPTDLLATAKSVIVFFIPFVPELAEENTGGKFPARAWGQAYADTNELIGDTCQKLDSFLAERGYKSAVTPPTANFDHVKLVSRWSHKHLGYLCGLGRFGLNRQLITPQGCVGRLGSLVTEAELGDNPLTELEHHCLNAAGQDCLVCVSHCPVGALTEDGFNRARCWDRLVFNLERREEMAGLPDDTHVCGKCVVDLPCSFTNPVTG